MSDEGVIIVSIPSRGFWFFEGEAEAANAGWRHILEFQSPRGDFGFLKRVEHATGDNVESYVSIPSRGFWFFEGDRRITFALLGCEPEFQSPRGDFGFLKILLETETFGYKQQAFQSPRGDFGFLKSVTAIPAPTTYTLTLFQSPRGDFGFLKPPEGGL